MNVEPSPRHPTSSQAKMPTNMPLLQKSHLQRKNPGPTLTILTLMKTYNLSIKCLWIARGVGPILQYPRDDE